MAKDIQIEIGQEGEMVTIPLTEYENLIKAAKVLKELVELREKLKQETGL